MPKSKQSEKDIKITSTIAKSEDGTVQITFAVPGKLIEEQETHAVEHLAADMEIPGFRRGKAPLEKAKERISKEKLLEHTLSHILPAAFAQSLSEHKLKPIAYPKFEVLSQGEMWQIRATTAELVDFDLGDYKKIVSEALNSPKLWKPGDDKEQKEVSREEKEQKALQVLLESIKVTVPNVLVEEEVNIRLSQLLARIEKLGLTLESYLSSLGRSVDQLKTEYVAQTTASIALELILNKIAETEKIAVPDAEVDQAISAISANNPTEKTADTTEQRRVVESVLRRRAVLDSLLGSAVSLG